MHKKIIIATLAITFIFSSCKKKTDEFNQVYEVEFKSTWSKATHPTDFPSNAHMSPFLAASHKADYEHFKSGSLASEGIKVVAETGNTAVLEEEYDKLKSNKTVLDYIKGKRIDSPGNTDKVELGVDNDHTNVTVVTMVAPSPDWFVAVKTSLKQNGEWVDELTVPVKTYDSGTDSGVTFTSENNPTTPAQNTHLITTGPLTEGSNTVVNMGTFYFKRIK